MKARLITDKGTEWENINYEDIKKIHLTPFAYFNIEFNNCNIYSYDKLDTVN